jgi:hypothetical protein
MVTLTFTTRAARHIVFFYYFTIIIGDIGISFFVPLTFIYCLLESPPNVALSPIHSYL